MNIIEKIWVWPIQLKAALRHKINDAFMYGEETKGVADYKTINVALDLVVEQIIKLFQPEIERLVTVTRLEAEIKVHDEYWHSQKYVEEHGIGALALANREATKLELRQLTQLNQKEGE